MTWIREAILFQNLEEPSQVERAYLIQPFKSHPYKCLTKALGLWLLILRARNPEAGYLCSLFISRMLISVDFTGFFKFGLLGFVHKFNRFSSRHCSFNLLELSESQSRLRSLIINSSVEACSNQSLAISSRLYICAVIGKYK